MASFPDPLRGAKPSANPEGSGMLVRHRKPALLLAALWVAAVGATVAFIELATLQRNGVPATRREAVRA